MGKMNKTEKFYYGDIGVLSVQFYFGIFLLVSAPTLFILMIIIEILITYFYFKVNPFSNSILINALELRNKGLVNFIKTSIKFLIPPNCILYQCLTCKTKEEIKPHIVEMWAIYWNIIFVAFETIIGFLSILFLLLFFIDFLNYYIIILISFIIWFLFRYVILRFIIKVLF